MEPHADTIEELAALQHVSGDAVRGLLAALHERAGAEWFYLFWVSAGGARGGQRMDRTRTLLAFPTPDAALTFAQRNQLSDTHTAAPRVRRLSVAQLLLVMLRDPAIVAVRLVRDEETTAGRMPAGELIERAAVLEQLHDMP